MAIGDMRRGRCAVCGGGEVYHAEVSGHLTLCKPDGFFANQEVFAVLVCAGCGYTQWYTHLDEGWRDWLQRKARRVPPPPPE